MKKLLLPICLFMLLCVSCKSNEGKAQKLIDEYMFKNLFDYSTYEPIETVIDSAFTTIYRDSAIRNQAITMITTEELVTVYFKKFNHIMELSKYSSDIGEYLQEANEELQKSTPYIELCFKADSTIKVLASNFPKDFIGWEAKHRFRSKNRDGSYTIGNYTYIIDPKFNSILESYDTEDENEQKIILAIDEALTSDYEIYDRLLNL